MRQKKHKKIHRTLTFLKISHHFKEPYKVVLDGNFINALLQTKTDAFEALGKLLSAPIKLFTSRCVLAELRQLGPDFAGAHVLLSEHELTTWAHRTALLRCTHMSVDQIRHVFLITDIELGTSGTVMRACLTDAAVAARDFMVLHCGHENNPYAPSECMADLVSGGNPEHLFIATQDRALRGRLMAQPGCAAVFASVNGLHLEAPSVVQKAEARAAEVQHLSVGRHELKSEALAAAMQEKSAGGGKGIFKRKKAKGPNPLAMKKGKKAAQQQQSGGSQQKPHRKRARRRGTAAADGADQAA